MRPGRTPTALAGALCLGWLTLTTGYAAAAAAPSVDLGGQPLPGGGAGSTDAKSPTVLEPGLWDATLEGEFPQYFSYDRRMKESTVHIGVMGAPGAGTDSVQLATEVRADDGTATDCGSEDDASEYATAHAVIGASVVVGHEAGTAECRSAATIQITVSRGYTSNTGDLPYVLKVVEEAPVATDPSGVEADAEPAYSAPSPAGSPAEEAGAASFSKAPVLEARSGVVTVRSSVPEGTEQLWRVPLHWGDQLVARADVAKAEGEDAKTFEFGGPDVSLQLVDPLRDRFRYVASDQTDDATGEYRGDEAATLVASGYPVRRANGSLPGDYWVSVAVEPAPEDRDAVDVPVELTVEVVDSGAEPPAHQKAVLAQDGGAGPDGYSADEPFLVGDGTFSAVASGNPVVDDADGTWLTTRRWTGIGLGLASVACLAGGLWRLRARR